MHAFVKTAGIIVTAGIMLSVALSPANAVPGSAAGGGDINTTVLAGTLTASATAPTSMTDVTLNGTDTLYSTGTAPVWTITNARGDTAPWTLSASATDFTSAAGSGLDSTARTLAVTNLIITPGAVVAAAGSDAAPSTSAVTMSTSSQALVSSTTGTGKGKYTLSGVGYSLHVPADTFRSNWPGAFGAGSQTPYVSTITFTIA